MATADKDDTQAALAVLMANSIAADSAAKERRAPIQALVDTIKAVSEAITHLEQRQDLLEDTAEGAQGDYEAARAGARKAREARDAAGPTGPASGGDSRGSADAPSADAPAPDWGDGMQSGTPSMWSPVRHTQGHTLASQRQRPAESKADQTPRQLRRGQPDELRTGTPLEAPTTATTGRRRRRRRGRRRRRRRGRQRRQGPYTQATREPVPPAHFDRRHWHAGLREGWNALRHRGLHHS